MPKDEKKNDDFGSFKTSAQPAMPPTSEPQQPPTNKKITGREREAILFARETLDETIGKIRATFKLGTEWEDGLDVRAAVIALQELRDTFFQSAAGSGKHMGAINMLVSRLLCEPVEDAIKQLMPRAAAPAPANDEYD